MPRLDFTALLQGQYLDWLLSGFVFSLQLTGLTLLAALPLALAIALLRMAPSKLGRGLGFAYVEGMRNVPLLVHLLFWYFGAPEALPEALKTWLYAGSIETVSALIALTLYTAAFMAEDMRSGLRGVPSGQLDAARALGFDFLPAMHLILLPQALRQMLPSLVNEFFATLKATSLGSIIGLAELSHIANQINGQVLVKPLEVYGTLALGYFVLCFGLSRLAFALERRSKV